MREIPLRCGRVALVDDEDYAALCIYKWRANECGYVVRTVRNSGRSTPMRMHRQILSLAPGVPADHINGNRLDNRRSNLRLCTWRQNAMNRGKRRWRRGIPAQSQFIGVTRGHGGRWRACIKRDGRQAYLGSFAEEIEAARAHDAAARELHGEFARLNFPVAEQVGA